MKLLLDEMHAPSIARVLVESGEDVVAVAAEASLRGPPDADLLVHAAASGRALVTENIADFARLTGRWTTEGRSHAGLIFTNPKRFNRASVTYPGDVVAALRRFLAAPPVVGDSWTWWL